MRAIRIFQTVSEGKFSELGSEDALCKTIPGSAQPKRHKRRCQGAIAVHKQVTNGVGHAVFADEEPLEDLPVGTDRDSKTSGGAFGLRPL